MVTGSEPCLRLPREKDDWVAVEDLRRAVEAGGYNEHVLAAFPALLEWAVDPNWPVASPIGAIVAEAGIHALPSVEMALQGADEEGQMGLMLTVVRVMPQHAKLGLCRVLEEIATSASDEVLREATLAELAGIRGMLV